MQRLPPIGRSAPPPFHGIVTWSPTIDPEHLKLLSQEIVLGAGVHLVFHAWAAAPIVEEGRVTGAVFESKEGRLAIPRRGDDRLHRNARCEPKRCAPRHHRFCTDAQIARRGPRRAVAPTTQRWR
jgi:hypothetical protein